MRRESIQRVLHRQGRSQLQPHEQVKSLVFAACGHVSEPWGRKPTKCGKFLLEQRKAVGIDVEIQTSKKPATEIVVLQTQTTLTLLTGVWEPMRDHTGSRSGRARAAKLVVSHCWLGW